MTEESERERRKAKSRERGKRKQWAGNKGGDEGGGPQKGSALVDNERIPRGKKGSRGKKGARGKKWYGRNRGVRRKRGTVEIEGSKGKAERGTAYPVRSESREGPAEKGNRCPFLLRSSASRQPRASPYRWHSTGSPIHRLPDPSSLSSHRLSKARPSTSFFPLALAPLWRPAAPGDKA